MKHKLETLVTELAQAGVPLRAAMAEFEKVYIGRVLERVKGNQSRAARLLHLHRNTVARKIGMYQLNGGEDAGRKSA